MRIAVLALTLAAFAASPGGAQTTARADPDLAGIWTSTLHGVDRDVTPPFKYDQTVNLMISPNGNVFLERLTRPRGGQGAERYVASGVYTLIAPGLIGLTFGVSLGQPAAWRYRIVGEKLTIVDGSNVSRTFIRARTAI